MNCRECKIKVNEQNNRNQFYCSRKCYLKYKSKNTKFLTCLICKKEFKVTLSNYNRGRKYCLNKCMGVAYSKSKKGSRNPMYKDGKNTERLIERDACRSTIEYKNFLRKVFIRDRNSCQKCGIKRKRIKDGKGKNNNLTVHHIKSWKEYPLLRYRLSNGIVFCNPCHKLVHKKV